VAEVGELVRTVADLLAVAFGQEHGHPVEQVVPAGHVALLQLDRQQLVGAEKGATSIN
jgi:hypothetical protein